MEMVKNEMRANILSKIILNKMHKKSNSSSLKSDFLNNFKCLQQNQKFIKLKKQNELNEILKEYNESSKFHVKNFDFGVYEKRLSDMETDPKLLEAILLEKYDEVAVEIVKKKEVLLKLRENISFSFKNIRRLEQEVSFNFSSI